MCSLCRGGWFQAPSELRLSLERAKGSVSHLHLEVQILISILLLFPSSLAAPLSVISSWVVAKPRVGRGESLNTRRENEQLPSSWGDFKSPYRARVHSSRRLSCTQPSFTPATHTRSSFGWHAAVTHLVPPTCPHPTPTPPRQTKV